jgi:type VI secretion system protein ImpM
MPEAAVMAPGWFGKLPALGDFASRRLPGGFVAAWDEWLQQGLLASREQLGVGWLGVFLVAPMRRFWLAPGLVEERAWAGLMMPSVDRVGRHFPLMVAWPLGSLAHALAARDAFAALDAVLRGVLDVQASVESFEHALLALPALDGTPGIDAAAADEALAARVLTPRAESAPPRSIWWCGDAARDGDFLSFAGLPPPAAFAQLLAAQPPDWDDTVVQGEGGA